MTATEELQNRNASLAQQTGELKAQLEVKLHLSQFVCLTPVLIGVSECVPKFA